MDQRVEFTQRFITAVKKGDEERTKEDYDYIVYVLKKLPEFYAHDDNALRLLAKDLTAEVVDRDSILYDTDNIATCWYYILTGSVLISSQLFLNGMSIGKCSYDNYYRNEMCLVLEQTELLKFTYPSITEQHLSSTPTTGSSGQQSPETVLPGFTRSCSPQKNPSDIYDIKNSVSSLPIYPVTEQHLDDVDGKAFPNSMSDGNIVELSITEPSDHNLTDSKCNRETIDLFNLTHFGKPHEGARDSTISGASLDEVFSNSPISRRVSCPVKVSMQRSLSNDSLDKAYESSVIVDDDLSFSARSNDDSELASSSYRNSYRNSKRLEVPRFGGSTSSILSDDEIYPVDRNIDSDEESEMSEGSSGTLDCVLTCLSKPSHERTEDDIEGLLDVLAMLPAFSKLTSAVRRSILKLMVLKTVEEDETIINNGEEIDCWYVVLNGYLRYCRENEQEKHLHVGESYGINQSLKVHPHSGKLMGSKDCQYGYLHITEFSQIIHEGEENIKRETDEDGQLVRVMELRSAGNKRKGYFLIQATPEKLLDHLLEETVDDSYHADFLLTYRTFLTSPGEIFDKLLTNWNERAEVHDQIISIVLHWVTNHYGDFDGDDEMTGFLDRFEELLKGEGRLGPQRALDLARTTYSRPHTIELEREAAKSALDFQVGGGIDLSRPLFIISVLVGSSAHQKGLRVGDELLSINGSDCTKMPLAKAQRLLQNNYKLELSVKSNFPGYKDFVRNTPSSVIDQMDSATTVQTRNNTPAPPPMRPRVASIQHVKPRVGSNSSKESGGSPKLKLKDPVKILRSMTHKVTKEVNKAIKRQSTYDPDNTELHPPRPRSASSMHATSVERRPSGKKKAPLAKRASVDDIAAYSIDVPDGEVKHSSSVGNLNTIDLTEPVTTVTGTTTVKGTVVDAVIKLYTLDHSYKFISVSQKTTVGEVIERAVREFYPEDFCENVRQEYCIALVTVAGRDGPVRNSVLPPHLADLPNYIGLSSRYYLKKRDTLATLIQDEVQQEMIKESKIHKQILKLDPLVLAQEFTRIDSLVFTEIDATEYLDDLWRRDGPHMHIHITKFEEMTNNHLYWTVTTILQEQSGTRRAEIVKHMIKIARYLKDLRNYNTMFAILSGLNHSLVQRLKPTWEKVPGKYRKMKKDLEIFMDPTRNFVKYRNLLKGSDRPLIPYFPVAKKDLTFIYLGNDSMVENMVNFEKLRMIAREVKNCKQYCLTPIMPPPVEAVTVHLGTPPKSLHGSLRIKFKSPTAYQATVNCLKRVYVQYQMRKRVKAFVEQPYIITDEGHLDVLFKILQTVNTHKKSDKKPDSPSGRHRTSRQSSIPSSIPSPKQGSLSSDSPPPSPKRTNTLGRNSKLASLMNGPSKANNKRAASPKIWAAL